MVVGSFLVALVAALFVGWQAWETRKSAQASHAAAQAAADGLRTANEALEVARREEAHSRVLVAEAQRSRIDSAFPEISVTPQRDAMWPPIAPSKDTPGDWVDCLPGAFWSLPSDGGERLGLKGQVHVHNGSAMIVQLRASYTNTKLVRADQTVTLLPGTGHTLHFGVWARVSEWAKGSPSDIADFDWGAAPPSVVYSDERDSGGSIEWRFSIVHPPIFEADETKPERYHLANFVAPNGIRRSETPLVVLAREHRMYWLSRERGRELAFPEVE